MPKKKMTVEVMREAVALGNRITEAVDQIMETIDDHEMAQAPTSKGVSAEYYEDIAERCRNSAVAIREEMGEDTSEEEHGG